MIHPNTTGAAGRRTALMVAVLAGIAPAAAAQAHPAESFANLVEALSPGVVAITVEREGAAAQLPRTPLERFFERRFGRSGPGAAPRAMASGSGFLIDADGAIVTNSHIIADAKSITVTLATGEALDAALIGADPKTDLALLKVDAGAPLPALEWGDSDALRVGDWTLAIGNPFGFGGTVTAGIISGRGRDINAGPYDDFLQTDAPINRGNSGGPLFDLDGKVIGVNTAIVSPNGGSVGIGFAIPAALATPIIAQLREHGQAVRGWLGVNIQTLNETLNEALGLDEAAGALVVRVHPQSPAAAAGIRTGDVITRWNGQEVEDPRHLARMVSATPGSTTVAVTGFRDGKPMAFEVAVAQDSKPAAVAQALEPRAAMTLGVQVAPAADGNGLTVVAVMTGGPADKAAMRPGDVIREAGWRPVTDAAALRAAIADAVDAGNPSLLLLVERNGNPMVLAAPLATS